MPSVSAVFDGGGSPLEAGAVAVTSAVILFGKIEAASIIAGGGPGACTIGVKACKLADYPSGLTDLTGGNDLATRAVIDFAVRILPT